MIETDFLVRASLISGVHLSSVFLPSFDRPVIQAVTFTVSDGCPVYPICDKTTEACLQRNRKHESYTHAQMESVDCFLLFSAVIKNENPWNLVECFLVMM